MTTPITTVAGKGAPLNATEFDTNLINIRDAADAAQADVDALTPAAIFSMVAGLAGPGSGFDADLLDGKHFSDLNKADSVYTDADPDLTYTAPVFISLHANGPDGGTSYFYYRNYYFSDTNQVLQIAFQYNGGGRVAWRNRYAGVWSAWYEILGAGLESAGGYFFGSNYNAKALGIFSGTTVLSSAWTQGIAANCYFDGTNWMRYDTGQIASLMQLAPSGAGIWYYQASAAANPITWDIYNGAPIFHSGVAGPGKGIDADSVDGQHAADILVLDTGGTLTADIFFAQPNKIGFANNQYIKDNSGGGLQIYIDNPGSHLNLDTVGAGEVKINNNKAWHAGNDGTGSGLDADLLDGSEAAAFVTHALATAANDFLVASGSGAYVKKTLAETKTVLGLGTMAAENAADWDDTGITFVIDGGGSTLTTGVKGDIVVPFDATITSCTMLADQSGSIVVDIWKDTYANFPPIDADSITASAVPTISTATKSQDSTLTGWTTSISSGDILRFNVDSVTTITRCTIFLKILRT